MELKAGYKNTEVGVIPEDWEVKKMEDLGKPYGGLSGKSKIDFVNGEFPYIPFMNIMLNPIINTSCFDYVNIGSNEAQNKALKGDLFFNGSSETPEEVGMCSVLLEDIHKLYLNSFCFGFRLNKELKTDGLYISYFCRSSVGRKLFYSMAQGATRYNLSKGNFNNLKISIPSADEQTAIATALSDADALITSLEKLIAKKRNIKQGAMQKLLQPKEDWEVKNLSSIGKPYGGLSGKSKIDFADGKFPYIPFMNIMSNPIITTSYLDYVNIGINENQNKALKGDLFFNGSSETPEEVGMCSILLEDIPNLYLNSFCFGFRLNKDSKENGLYLSYYFRSSEGRKLFYSMAQGATRYNLSKGNFNKMEVLLPKPEEQIETANILFDMDAEISALETKLDKYRKVKLGMMQNLLTGRVRLL